MQTASVSGKDVREFVTALYPFKAKAAPVVRAQRKAPALRVKATESLEALFKLDEFAYETGDFTDALLCEDL